MPSFEWDSDTIHLVLSLFVSLVQHQLVSSVLGEIPPLETER